MLRLSDFKPALLKRAALFAFVSLLALSPAFAGSETPICTKSAPLEFDPFQSGRHEIDLSGGFFHSPYFATKRRPTLDYAQGNASFGWMLGSPQAPFGIDPLRGNFELLGNVFGSGVTKGAGSYLAGGRLMLRCNFVQPQAMIVPFFEIGAGGLGNDVYNDKTQRLVGSGFEFSLVSNLGVRIFVSPHLSINLSGNFEHTSNANTASRNTGVNALGASLGAGYFY